MSENEGETVTAWITKYALTSGIYIVEGAWISKESPKMLVWACNNGINAAHGNDWHLTPEAALARAEEMRCARLKSLKESIAKLEKLNIVLPNVGKP